jgi:hypothetical protein
MSADVQLAERTAPLLAQVTAFVGRFVVLPSDSAAVAIALFVLHTWAIDEAEATPYLAIISPEKQTGKTRVLETLELAVRAPWATVSTTEAALFRKIDEQAPCLLLDEVDAIFGANAERTEPLRAVLNGGNRRRSTVTRTVGQGAKLKTKDFSVFCPKAIAGIDTGKLPETIRDRSIVLHMKRRRTGEKVERLRHRIVEKEAQPLRTELADWAASATALREATPELPQELSDRAADGWEPLFAIADVAGGSWPAEARRAALVLSAGADEETSRGGQLLAAIRDVIGERLTIATTELLEAINGEDELPFGGWNDGKGLDARGLARQLKPYGIKPKTVRVGNNTAKGYSREDLQDAWERYVPSHAEPSVTDSANNDGRVTAVTPPTPPTRESLASAPSPACLGGVTSVTPSHETPGNIEITPPETPAESNGDLSHDLIAELEAAAASFTPNGDLLDEYEHERGI